MTEPGRDEDKIDPEGFVRELVAAMHEAGVEEPYTFDTETGIFGDEQRGQIDVKQLYLSIAGHKKWQRDGVLKKVATYYAERPQMPTDWSYARPRVVLTIVPRMAEEAHILQHPEGPQSLPLARITPHVAFGVGFPISIGNLNVNVGNLETWGVEPEDVFQAAAANLEKRSNRPWASADKYPGVFGSQYQDGFDACRIFFPLRFMSAPLKGKPVVVLPTPNRMIFAGSDDETGLVNLARLARTYVEKKEGSLFLRPMKVGDDGESWVDWLPPRTHPARAGLRWLQARQEAMNYLQGAALLRVAAKSGPITAALPELEIVESGYGADVYTTTVWDDKGPCALPKADRIVLRQKGRVLGTVRWASLVAKFPHLLKESPGYPTRFAAGHFPENWQLQMIAFEPPDGTSNG